MAEKKPEPAAEGGEAPKKKGKLLLFIIIGVVVLVLVGGGAAFMLLKKAPAEDGEDGDAPAKSEKSAKKKAKKADPSAVPAFYKFDKAFTVKLQADGTEAYLQAEVQVKLLNVTLVDQMKLFDPEIKHKVTLLLLGKKQTDLNNPVGVQKLSNEIRDTINNILEPSDKKKAAEPADEADADAPVQMVLFTTFIVQ